MNIYLVRHGETEWNKEEVFRGRRDVALNARGLRQAELTGCWFEKRRVDRIVSSPLSRALKTAEGIARATGVPVEADEAFTDIAFGQWEGFSLEDVARRFPRELDIWRTHPHKFRMAGVESLARVRKRVIAGLRSRKHESLVIVTHRVICKVLILHVLGMPNRYFWRVKCDPASISLFEVTAGEPLLQFMNETCHLQGNGPEPCADF